MGAELKGDALAVSDIDPKLLRRAAVRAADQIGAGHPHPLDTSEPRLAGRIVACDTAVRGEVLDFLDLFGIRPDQIRKRGSHA